MPAWNTWNRFAALSALVGALVLAGCSDKKADPPKPEGEAKVEKEKPKPKPAPKSNPKPATPEPEPDPTPEPLKPPPPLPKPKPPEAPESLKDVKPDVVYTVATFDAENSKDFNFLITKHADKVVELTGVVDSFTQLGPVVGSAVWLKGEGVVGLVNCPVADYEPWKKVTPGQTATLRVRAPKSKTDRRPFAWRVVNVTGPAAVEYTAERLSKEWTADKEAVEKKLEGKWLIVTGDVHAITFKDNIATVPLAAAGQPLPITCEINTALGIGLAEKLKALKAGEKFHVLAKLRAGKLDDCKHLEPAR